LSRFSISLRETAGLCPRSFILENGTQAQDEQAQEQGREAQVQQEREGFRAWIEAARSKGVNSFEFQMVLNELLDPANGFRLLSTPNGKEDAQKELRQEVQRTQASPATSVQDNSASSCEESQGTKELSLSKDLEEQVKAFAELMVTPQTRIQDIEAEFDRLQELIEDSEGAIGKDVAKELKARLVVVVGADS